MLDPMHETWGKYFQDATSWLRDRGLCDGVSKQSVDEGVVPANKHVWQEHMASIPKGVTGALRPEKNFLHCSFVVKKEGLKFWSEMTLMISHQDTFQNWTRVSGHFSLEQE